MPINDYTLRLIKPASLKCTSQRTPYYYCVDSNDIYCFSRSADTKKLLLHILKNRTAAAAARESTQQSVEGVLVQLRSAQFSLGLGFGRQGEGNVPAELPGQCGLRRRLVKSNRARLRASCPLLLKKGKEKHQQANSLGKVLQDGTNFDPFLCTAVFFSPLHIIKCSHLSVTPTRRRQ